MSQLDHYTKVPSGYRYVSRYAWIMTTAKYFRQQILKVWFAASSFSDVDARLREADDANNRKRVISLIDRLFSGVTVTISPGEPRRKSHTHRRRADYHSPGEFQALSLLSSGVANNISPRDAHTVVLHHLSLATMPRVIYLQSLDYRVSSSNFFAGSHYPRTKVSVTLVTRGA